MHGGDRRLGQPQQLERDVDIGREHVMPGIGGLVLVLDLLAQVVPGRERPPGAPHHDDLDRVIPGGLLDRVAERVNQRITQSVQLVGPVQRDPSHRCLYYVLDDVLVHG